jgi:aryl-alcohol dehydrogenase-like predicted oxidoreductase
MTDSDSTQKKRYLGHTDIQITPIGLGTWQLSEGQGISRFTWPVLPTEETNDIVKTALDNGINWFDTAEFYGKGRSEMGLAHALKAAGMTDGSVIIATKWWPFFRRASSIKSTIDERLRCLAPYGIDLHQIHWPFSFSAVETEMDAMADLVEAKKIRAVGVSNFSAKMMRRAHKALARRGIPLASNQVRYNLLARKIETSGVLDTAKELGVTIISYMPLEMGLLTGKFHRDPSVLRSRPLMRRRVVGRMMGRSLPVMKLLEEVAERHSVTPAQVALNWLVNFNGDLVVAIPGASKPHHAGESAGAMSFNLPVDEMMRIEQVSRQFR